MQTQYIPLSKLCFSLLNVRTVKASNAADKELIASIKANGLLQNMVVIPKGKTKYEVVAGGRRLSALDWLLDQGEIEKQYPVNCLIATPEKATEISLSENLNRADMHPADQLSAFQKLIDDGSSIADISMSFGKPKTHIKRVLALAAVHPELINAFKQDKLNLECLEAFTVTGDKEKQLEFYQSADWLQPYAIRRALTKSGYASTSAIAKLVGKKRYKAKGGVITCDLFENEEYFEDGEVLRSIALELLSEASKQVEDQGWSWVTCDGWGSYVSHEYSHMRGEYIDVPETLTEKIEAQSKVLQETDFESYEDEEQEEQLLRQLEAEKEHYLQFTEVQKNHSGVVVTYNHKGIVFHYGVADEKDMKTYLNLSQSTNKEGGNSSESDDQAAEKTEPPYSNALMDSLVLQDVQLSQLNMLQNPELSAEAFMFDVCYQQLSGRDSWRYASLFSFEVGNEIDHDEKLTDFIAYTESQKLIEGINLTWLKDSVEDSYTAFIALSQTEQYQLFGQASAMSVSASQKYCMANSIYSQLQARSGFNKSAHWLPTQEHFFSRLTLVPLQELCEELFGKKWLQERKKFTKKKLAESAENAYLVLDNQDFIPEVMR